MTPFQAIKTSFYMLLAESREPIEESALAPALASAARRPSSTARSSDSPVKMAQLRRRQTDWPQPDSIMQRSWKALLAWIARLHTGTKR
jgi:hypothetical protein